MKSSNSPLSAEDQFSDEYWMEAALARAATAQSLGEVPVGAVVVANNQLIGEGWNTPIRDHDPSAHAEMQAIRMAARHQQNYRLVGATLYVTLEPCPMCAGAIVHARLDRVVYGASDLKTGAAGSAMQLLNHAQLNHQPTITAGILHSQCSQVISAFFAQRRAQIKAAKQARKAHGAD